MLKNLSALLDCERGEKSNLNKLYLYVRPMSRFIKARAAIYKTSSAALIHFYSVPIYARYGGGFILGNKPISHSVTRLR
jgi:hypothetical protein